MAQALDKPIFVKIDSLTKSYVPGVPVLNGLDLSMERGTFLCILGPSGCGKSTLLRCIAGFEDYSGTIRVDDKVVSAPSPDRIVVFQNYEQLLPWKSVAGNIEYPFKVRGEKDKKLLASISEACLRKVGLIASKDKYPYQLSGGMKQRVAIARALALRPKLILMDEPLASLDAITRNNIQHELAVLHADTGVTVIFITHNIQEALTLGTRLIVMSSYGSIKIDIANPLAKPVSPSSPGYGAAWDMFYDALYNDQ